MSGPAGGGSIAARFVAVDSDRHLAPGEIVWDRDGAIVAVRKARGTARAAVLDACVWPGLVDAHLHAGIPALATAERRFVPWLGAVMKARADAPHAEAAAARAAIADLTASGVTAIGDIDSTGRTAAPLARAPLRGRSYRELTGFHLDASAARALVRERLADARAHPRLLPGLSPHAPYSASPALIAAAAAAARHLAIHCAEAPEEQQFLRTGRGPFRDLLERLGRLPAGFRAPGVGAVAWLDRLGALRPTTQLVHCQELERGDLARIAAAGASIAVCPNTIAWFRREAPPVPRWLAAGVPVALGTDSRASNPQLSMLEELKRATALWPSLAPAALLAMATRHGARSLGLRGCGALRRGARADFAVTGARATFAATLAGFVHGELLPFRVVSAGRRAFDRGTPR